MSKAHSNPGLDSMDSGDRGLTAAVIRVSDPRLGTVVCGMTVLERMVSVLRNASIPIVLLGAPPTVDAPAQEKPRPQPWSGADCPGISTESLEKAIGRAWNGGERVLLFTSPVVLDGRAIEFLRVLGSADACVRLCGPAGQNAEDAAAFLVDAASLDDLLASVFREGLASPGGRNLPWVPVTQGVFQPMDEPGGRRLAQTALLQSLGKPTDGFLAAWIDRRISRRLSALLVRTPITPNALTLLGLVPALAGAVLLSRTDPLWSAAGALLFLASTVLDGCDGEVARLKHKTSARGARLDILCDNVALVAVFLGVVVHVYREFHHAVVWFLAAAMIAGMLGCMVSEYLLILRHRIGSGAARAPEAPHGLDPVRVRWYERLASRDFAYVLPLLAYFGLLRPLVWAAAIGVNVFWVVLVAFVARPTGRGL